MNILIDYGILISHNDHYIVNDDFKGDSSIVLEISGELNTIKRIKPIVNKESVIFVIDELIQCFLMKIVKQVSGTEFLKREPLIQECIARVKYRVEVDRSRVNKNLVKLINGDYLKVNDDDGGISYSS